MNTSEAAPEQRFLTTQEVADILRASPKFVRTEIEAGALPAYCFGGNFKIEVADLEKYIQERRVKPSATSRGEASE